MRNGVTNRQIRALAMAMAGATVAAVATMFIPVAMLENVTGSTGISELVPAAAAPLGDTARAMIAFGVGALTLAVLGYVLPRQNEAPPQAASASVSFDEPQTALSLKERLAGLPWPKMPWTKDEDDITELSDLPKLRNGDIHPDAPPRRPLSAHQDLPVLELSDVAAPTVTESITIVAPNSAMPVVEVKAAETPSDEPVAATSVSPQDAQPTLAEMVAQLEAAVAERQKQLADLEVVAAQLAARRSDAVAAKPEVAIVAEAEVIIEPARTERPTLEAVPASPAKDDDMDAALAAALATLHRMNGTDR